jgi:hypothetical protein
MIGVGVVGGECSGATAWHCRQRLVSVPESTVEDENVSVLHDWSMITDRNL